MKKSGGFLILCSFMMLFGIYIGLNSNSWLMMWMGMEITLMAFIPRLIITKSVIESYSSSKYFIFQCLGSTFFLLGSLDSMFLELMIFGLFMKLGIFPNHFWVLSVSKGLSWINFFYLMTVQKILPIYILLYFITDSSSIFFPLLILNSLVGNIFSLNQLDLRNLFIYSSMNHMTWMVISSFMNWYFFYFYLLFYIVMMMILCIYLQSMNIYYFSQIFYYYSMNKFTKLISFMVLFLSFMGFPPFMGFFLKFLSLLSGVTYLTKLWLMVLLMMNLSLTYSYLRLFIYLFLYNNRSIVEDKNYYWLNFVFIFLFVFLF